MFLQQYIFLKLNGLFIDQQTLEAKEAWHLVRLSGSEDRCWDFWCMFVFKYSFRKAGQRSEAELRMKHVERRGQHRARVLLGMQRDLGMSETGMNNVPFAENILRWTFVKSYA